VPSVFNRQISSPVLIGRHLEVASLRALVDGARQGQGQAVLIGGEAGIGKSRLAAEVKALAQAQGFLVLQGNCFPTDRSSPLAPVLDFLTCSPARERLALSTAGLEPIARELALLHPGLVPLPSGKVPARFRDPGPEKRHLLAALTRSVADLAMNQPVLLSARALGLYVNYCRWRTPTGAMGVRHQPGADALPTIGDST
jgi:predicted ATPase